MNHATAHTVTLWCAAFSKIEKGIERRLSGTGCTLIQYRVLLQLARPETSQARPSRLSRVLAVRPSVAGLAVEALEARGLVRTQGGSEGGRGALASATQAGLRLLEGANLPVEAFLSQALSQLGPDEGRLLMEMMHDALAVPGGVFLCVECPVARGEALPLPYLLSSIVSFTQVVATTAKNAAGLSLTEYRFLLELLAKRRGVVKRLRAKDMTALLRVTRSYVTTTAYKLEERGLLVRDPDPDDARGVLFGLTAAGERLVGDIGDDVAAAFEGMFGMRPKNPERVMRAGRLLLQGVDAALEATS